MDVEILARVQFAFTAAFHYIYPPLSIGLGLFLVLVEGLYLKTKQEIYFRMARFWVKIFGLTFAIGVASGIVMEFEFGTNWASYSRFVGDIFGSALAAEGIFAFFLESGFLAILLFGWNKVGPKLHFFSTCMVALGAHFSAVWIIVANSWQQTPAGSHLEINGVVSEMARPFMEGDIGHARMVIDDFWAVVFNPSTVERLSHTVIGAWLSAAFLVISVSAYYLLKRKHIEFSRISMRLGLGMAVISSLLALVSGHDSAVVVAEHQPSKLAAMEGVWESGPNASSHVFGWVDEKNQVTHGLEIPGLLSWMIGGTTEQEVTGLKDIPGDLRPPVQPVFQFFHLMVTIGMLLIFFSLLGLILLYRDRLFNLQNPISHLYLRVAVVAVLLPQIANQLGWFTAEIGRQPWIVWGYLKTSEGLSKVVVANQVLASLIGFTLIYLLLFILFLFLLDRKIKKGPEAGPDVVAGIANL